ncbi:MAG TPA: lysylphosphatidylglycerol synthase transmembrane domain-containing protein [Anaerolineae bacterium]|nr:lysylphosphatidylglycerol synthase transmembrane domain-containing protein [Anaerolineae bacterium]
MKIKATNLLKIGVSLALLIVVIVSVGADNLLAVLRGIDLGWFALALAIHLIGIAIRAYRWWLLVAALGTPVSFKRLLYLYFVGNFFSTALPIPTGIGGDVVKILELSPERGGAHAFSTVFADRLTGLLGSSLIALVVALIDPADMPPDVSALVVVVSGGILLATLLLTQGRRFDRLIAPGRFFAHLPFQARLHKLYVALTSYSFGAIARSTLVSLPFTATLIATQYILSLALGLNIDVRYFVLFTPLVALTQALPISLNGLGVREGAYSVLFGSVGVAGSSAVALSLLYYVVRLISGLLGGALYVIGNLRSQNAGQLAETNKATR